MGEWMGVRDQRRVCNTGTAHEYEAGTRGVNTREAPAQQRLSGVEVGLGQQPRQQLHLQQRIRRNRVRGHTSVNDGSGNSGGGRQAALLRAVPYTLPLHTTPTHSPTSMRPDMVISASKRRRIMRSTSIVSLLGPCSSVSTRLREGPSLSQGGQ